MGLGGPVEHGSRRAFDKDLDGELVDGGSMEFPYLKKYCDFFHAKVACLFIMPIIG